MPYINFWCIRSWKTGSPQITQVNPQKLYGATFKCFWVIFETTNFFMSNSGSYATRVGLVKMPTYFYLARIIFATIVSVKIHFFRNPTPNTQDPVLGKFSWPKVTDPKNLQYVNISDTLTVQKSPLRFRAFNDLLLQYIQPPLNIFWIFCILKYFIV